MTYDEYRNNQKDQKKQFKNYRKATRRTIIFFIIGSEFFINYKIKFREKEAITKPETQETVKEGNEQ